MALTRRTHRPGASKPAASPWKWLAATPADQTMPRRPWPNSGHGGKDQARSALGFFPSGIAALCAAVDDKPVGLVATTFSVGVSYDPPLVLFSIQNSSRTWPCLRTAARLGVSILGEGQDHVCRQLASRTRDRFAGSETIRTANNSPLLQGSTLWLDCEILQKMPTGHHSIVVLEVMAMKAAGRRRPSRLPPFHDPQGPHTLASQPGPIMISSPPRPPHVALALSEDAGFLTTRTSISGCTPADLQPWAHPQRCASRQRISDRLN